MSDEHHNKSSAQSNHQVSNTPRHFNVDKATLNHGLSDRIRQDLKRLKKPIQTVRLSMHKKHEFDSCSKIGFLIADASRSILTLDLIFQVSGDGPFLGQQAQRPYFVCPLSHVR